MKKCIDCKKELPYAEFNKNKTRKDGLQTICRSCGKLRSKVWWEKVPTETRRIRADHQKNRRFENAKRLCAYLCSNPCVICGESDPVVLDFDHVNGGKKANVSTLVSGCAPWEKIFEEIAKCQVLCSNCHRRKTASDIGWYKVLVTAGSKPVGHPMSV